MTCRTIFPIGLLIAVCVACSAAESAPTFSAGPTFTKTGTTYAIAFTLSAPTDVEVTVVDGKGKVVRSLAAGVLGGKNPPPEPLQAGLAQKLTWDQKDDFGKPASAGPFKLRVRAGSGVKFGRLIGGNPKVSGFVTGVATDPDGNAYLMTLSGGGGNFKHVFMLDPDGKYVRTVLPFPANLPAERISAWARYDGAPRPINRNGLGPEFYTARSYYGDPVLSMLGHGGKKGLYFTDGGTIYQIGYDGGMIDGKYAIGGLWDKKALPNSGKGAIFLATSPDDKFLYLSGPFSGEDGYGSSADPDFPPGQVYRMELGKGAMQPFAKLAVTGKLEPQGFWVSAHMKAPGNYNVPHGPIQGLGIDKDGNVFVANPDHQRVDILNSAGKEIGHFAVEFPNLIEVHPVTGAIYVLTTECSGYRQFRKTLLKFANAKATAPSATIDFGTGGSHSPSMSLAASAKKTVLWIDGTAQGFVCVEDKGDAFAPPKPAMTAPEQTCISAADRLAVDPETDAVYINDTGATTLHYDGLTGKGGDMLKLGGDQSAVDMSIAADGFIYAQLGPGYSGPLARFTRDGKPAPYAETGTHVLHKEIYGASHPMGTYRTRGIGVARDGQVFVNWMYAGWTRYGVTGWGTDGKSIVLPDRPAGFPQLGIITPLGTENFTGLYAGAGIRVDSRGRIYVGLGVNPKDFKRPAGFENDSGYEGTVGSIVRFRREGGSWGREQGVAENLGDQPWFIPGPRPKDALEANAGNYFTGADRLYGGYGPMSSKHSDVGEPLGHSCSCRGGRFDIDLYDRLYIPNAVTNSVRIVDGNDNTICEFGSYGNVDSLWVPEGSKDGKPLIATPEIPFGWPVGVCWSYDHVYVSDMYNRRVVRVDRTCKLEKICEAK